MHFSCRASCVSPCAQILLRSDSTSPITAASWRTHSHIHTRTHAHKEHMQKSRLLVSMCQHSTVELTPAVCRGTQPASKLRAVQPGWQHTHTHPLMAALSLTTHIIHAHKCPHISSSSHTHTHTLKTLTHSLRHTRTRTHTLALLLCHSRPQVSRGAQVPTHGEEREEETHKAETFTSRQEDRESAVIPASTLSPHDVRTSHPAVQTLRPGTLQEPAPEIRA